MNEYKCQEPGCRFKLRKFAKESVLAHEETHAQMRALYPMHLGILDIRAVSQALGETADMGEQLLDDEESSAKFDLVSFNIKLHALVAIGAYVQWRVFHRKTPQEAIYKAIREVQRYAK